MRVFISGATGVIGSRVIPLMLAGGHRVTAVARTSEKRTELERMGAVPVQVDLFDPASVRDAVAGYDLVLNLATHIPPNSRAFLPGAWSENDRIRRIGSANLVDAAIAGGVQRFIQESFAPIYSDCGDQWINESTPLQPTRYNRTVVDAEKAVERFIGTGRTGIVLRFALFYGPDSEYTLDMIRFVRRGLAPGFGAADGFVSSVSHDDAATAVVAVTGARSGIYNVVDDNPVHRREFYDALAEALGVARPRLLPAWMAHFAGSLGETLSRSQRMSNLKLRTECAWMPKYSSVREGWRAVVEALATVPRSRSAKAGGR